MSFNLSTLNYFDGMWCSQLFVPWLECKAGITIFADDTGPHEFQKQLLDGIFNLDDLFLSSAHSLICEYYKSTVNAKWSGNDSEILMMLSEPGLVVGAFRDRFVVSFECEWDPECGIHLFCSNLLPIKCGVHGEFIAP